MKIPSYDRLLHTLYGPLADRDWATEFLEGLCRATRSRSAAVVAIDVPTRHDTLPAWVGAEAATAAAYEGRFREQNPWRDPSGSRAQAAGEVLLSDDAVPLHALKETPFWLDFLRPMDIAHGVGLIGLRTTREVASLTLLRSEKHGIYRGAELTLMRALAPHWAHACLLRSRLGLLTDAHLGLTDVLDRLTLGVLLLDRNGGLMRANAAGDRLLSEGTVLALSKGKPTALHGPARALLGFAIDAATAGPMATQGKASAVPLTDREGRPRALAGTHALAGGRYGAAHAVVFVQPVGAPLAAAAAMRQALMGVYGLTGREAELVGRLDGGAELVEAAEAMGLTAGACRTRLKAIFSKTGTRSQADLRATAGALRTALGA
jgi:DNA-binding CsgD family transcriptional regulator